MAARVACLAALALGAAANNGTVYIIRHGEKKWALGCLNDQGLARANALPGIFNGKPSADHETFATPTAVFANWYDDPVDCERCNQTAQPLAQSLGLKVDITHGGGQPGTGPNGGNTGAATAILDALSTTGGPVLAAWEHVNIQYLAQALGVAAADIPNWPNSDYDTVYVLDFAASKLTSFHAAAENFTAQA